MKKPKWGKWYQTPDKRFWMEGEVSGSRDYRSEYWSARIFQMGFLIVMIGVGLTFTPWAEDNYPTVGRPLVLFNIGFFVATVVAFLARNWYVKSNLPWHTYKFKLTWCDPENDFQRIEGAEEWETEVEATTYQHALNEIVCLHKWPGRRLYVIDKVKPTVEPYDVRGNSSVEGTEQT